MAANPQVYELAIDYLERADPLAPAMLAVAASVQHSNEDDHNYSLSDSHLNRLNSGECSLEANQLVQAITSRTQAILNLEPGQAGWEAHTDLRRPRGRLRIHPRREIGTLIQARTTEEGGLPEDQGAQVLVVVAADDYYQATPGESNDDPYRRVEARVVLVQPSMPTVEFTIAVSTLWAHTQYIATGVETRFGMSTEEQVATGAYAFKRHFAGGQSLSSPDDARLAAQATRIITSGDADLSAAERFAQTQVDATGSRATIPSVITTVYTGDPERPTDELQRRTSP